MINRLLVGVAGFEPAASCSQSRRDNRATLHPAIAFAIIQYFLFKIQINSEFAFSLVPGGACTEPAEVLHPVMAFQPYWAANIRIIHVPQ